MYGSIFSVLALIISGVLVFSYALPNYDETKALKVDQAELVDALEKAETADKDLQELTKTLESAEGRSDMGRLKVILPPHMDAIRLLNNVNGVALRHGLILGGINVEESNEPLVNAPQAFGNTVGVYQKVHVQFSVDAEYKDLVIFLKDLEKSLVLIDIDTVTFSTAGIDPTRNQVPRYQISFYTYWLAGE